MRTLFLMPALGILALLAACAGTGGVSRELVAEACSGYADALSVATAELQAGRLDLAKADRIEAVETEVSPMCGDQASITTVEAVARVRKAATTLAILELSE